MKKGQATSSSQGLNQMPIVLASLHRSHLGIRRDFQNPPLACDYQLREKPSMSDESRVAALKEILAAKPDDAFARYALGLEYSGSGATDAALIEFQHLLAAHPDYTNGYFMAAQTMARAERTEEARAMLRQGIECARRTGNQHALAEMEGMLDELERG
jgi:tetratricopeptide (TPR) repeat protein